MNDLAVVHKPTLPKIKYFDYESARLVLWTMFCENSVFHEYTEKLTHGSRGRLGVVRSITSELTEKEMDALLVAHALVIEAQKKCQQRMDHGAE